MIGGDAVGMSTVPEVIVARQLGMEVLGLSVLSNYAAGMPGAILAHDDVLKTVAAAAPLAGRLIQAVVARLAWRNVIACALVATFLLAGCQANSQLTPTPTGVATTVVRASPSTASAPTNPPSLTQPSVAPSAGTPPTSSPATIAVASTSPATSGRCRSNDSAATPTRPRRPSQTARRRQSDPGANRTASVGCGWVALYLLGRQPGEPNLL